MYRPFLVTAPTIKPVTLTEVKAALDISYTAKDTLITGLIAGATAWLDGWTGVLGRALCEQTWRQDYDGFRCWSNTKMPRHYGLQLRLPLKPVISITSVKYTDANGGEQTIGSTNYTLKEDEIGCYVEFITTYIPPTVGVESASVRVAYLAGYATATGVWTGPESIKQAMFLVIRQWFDNPTAAIVGATIEKMPFAVQALLAPYRVKQF